MSNSISKCKICQLPEKDRREIDRQLVRDANISALAQDYGVSRDSLYRHRANHVHASVAEGGRRVLQNHGSDLLQGMLDRMNGLNDRAESLLDRAEEKDNVRDALSGIQQIRNNYEFMGRILTVMSQAGLGLDPEELEAFQAWKEGQNTINMDLFSKEDKILIREVCIQKLSRMGSLPEVEDFRSKSFIVQNYGPQEADIISPAPDPISDEIVGSTTVLSSDTADIDPDQNPETVYRVDPEDHSLKPVRTTPRKEGPDPPMRRTRFD